VQRMRHGAVTCTAAALVCGIAATAHAVSIDVGSATGGPGQTVTVEVTLNSMGQEVAGAGATVSFESSTPIVSCKVNPDLNRELSGFSFHPEDCTPGVDCGSVTAIILGLTTAPIPDGAVLYTCKAQIAADAVAGSYALTIDGVSAADDQEQPLDAVGTDGSIMVTEDQGGGGGGGGCEVVSPSGSRLGWPLLLPLALLKWVRRLRRS